MSAVVNFGIAKPNWPPPLLYCLGTRFPLSSLLTRIIKVVYNSTLIFIFLLLVRQVSTDRLCCQSKSSSSAAATTHARPIEDGAGDGRCFTIEQKPPPSPSSSPPQQGHVHSWRTVQPDPVGGGGQQIEHNQPAANRLVLASARRLWRRWWDCDRRSIETRHQYLRLERFVSGAQTEIILVETRTARLAF